MKKSIVILVLAIVAGALSGVIASIATNQSLDQYAQSLAQSQQLLSISQEKPRPLPGTYEEALSRVQETGWPSMALVRPLSTDSQTASAWVTADSATGYGIVVTSDGWLLFAKDAFADYRSPEEQAEIWIQGTRYAISQVVEDTQTDAMLVKVDANALPTLAFGQSGEMLGGDLLFVVASANEMIPTSLKDGLAQIDGLVRPAESYVTEWELTDAVASPAPILNSSGELVGFALGENRAVPIHHMRPFIQSALRSGAVAYAGIGAYTAPVDRILNLDSSITTKTKFGALVAAPVGRTRAVVAGGPAETAGIQAGDVIIAVDDVLVTDSVSLAELLSSYQVGGTAVFTILRAGEQMDVSVTFSDLAEIGY